MGSILEDAVRPIRTKCVGTKGVGTKGVGTLLLVTLLLGTLLATSSAAVCAASDDDPIVGLWEGRKLDARAQVTEPWGPFLIQREDDGSLTVTYLDSRFGRRDQAMRHVRFDGDRLSFKMGSGAVLEALLRRGTLSGMLSHHGLEEDLELERIPNRSDRDIMTLLEDGRLSEAPPMQSELMSVLVHQGPDNARRLFEAVQSQDPDRQLWGPSAVNAYGYELLNQNQTALAVEVLRLNVAAYPQAANSFDSLGEAYLRNGDRELAIEALRHALSLHPRPEVRNNSLELLRELGALN